MQPRFRRTLDLGLTASLENSRRLHPGSGFEVSAAVDLLLGRGSAVAGSQGMLDFGRPMQAEQRLLVLAELLLAFHVSEAPEVL